MSWTCAVGLSAEVPAGTAHDSDQPRQVTLTTDTHSSHAAVTTFCTDNSGTKPNFAVNSTSAEKSLLQSFFV